MFATEEKETRERSTQNNGQKLQSVIGDNLFPEVQHISDVKQVLELMKGTAQNLREEQIRGILLLQELGNNKMLHGDKNPYENIIKKITGEFKVAVANPGYYLDTIEELIPKPPKPVILTERGKVVGGGRN